MVVTEHLDVYEAFCKVKKRGANDWVKFIETALTY